MEIDKTINEQLREKLLEKFTLMKSMQFQNIICVKGLSFNEKNILFIIYKNMKDEKISLSILRENLKLAPSTITPIITLLEEKKLIKREIDKKDRRNIYLKITKQGMEYTNNSYLEMTNTMDKYIEFMGHDDIQELIKLLDKTTHFFKKTREEIENE